MPDPEFVTISRASQLLEAPERTVRRMAAKLADTDRQVADRGTRLVRLVALASLMGKDLPTAPADPMADTQSTGGGQVADTLGDMAAKDQPVADTVGQPEGDWRARALVAEARLADTQAERDRLIREKDKDREELTGVLEALRKQAEDSDKRLAAVLAGTGRLQIASPGTSDGSQSSPETLGGGITTPDQAETPKRGIRDFLRRWW